MTLSTPTAAELVELYGEPDDLADVGDIDNVGRANLGLVALNAFLAATRSRPDEQIADVEALRGDGWALEVIGDLLCDVFHLITLVGEDVDEMIGYGMRHFVAEVGLGYDQ